MQLLFIQTWETVPFSKANSFLIMLLTWFENFEYHNISKTFRANGKYSRHEQKSPNLHGYGRKKKDLASIRRSHNKKLLYKSLLSI